jgi:hypothetical protein
MIEPTLLDLRVSVNDRRAFDSLEDYRVLAHAYLSYLQRVPPTRILSPARPHYIFYQYTDEHQPRITRPLNTNLFFEDAATFDAAFDRFLAFLSDLARHEDRIVDQTGIKEYLLTREIDRIIYTVQQSAGCIADASPDANQARKRIGQIFEKLVNLVMRAIGLDCEPRTIRLPVTGFPDYPMPYELDLVFSRAGAIVTRETRTLHPDEIVGSVKTTSEDRIDKIFLDKYLLTKLLGREVPVVALFLHDVQRAQRGQSIFGINSTFKSNHFLGYTVALNRLDGVYYIDLEPEMMTNALLQAEIRDFQRFLVEDIWRLLKR